MKHEKTKMQLSRKLNTIFPVKIILFPSQQFGQFGNTTIKTNQCVSHGDIHMLHEPSFTIQFIDLFNKKQTLYHHMYKFTSNYIHPPSNYKVNDKD